MGIRVTGIFPGYVATAMTTEYASHSEGDTDQPNRSF